LNRKAFRFGEGFFYAQEQRTRRGPSYAKATAGKNRRAFFYILYIQKSLKRFTPSYLYDKMGQCLRAFPLVIGMNVKKPQDVVFTC